MSEPAEKAPPMPPSPEEAAAYREAIRQLVDACLQRLDATPVRDDVLPVLTWDPGRE